MDFLQQAPGVVFDDSWERRVTVKIEGVPICFIGLDDLITNKRAVGRVRDRQDVRALEKAKAFKKR